MTINVVVTVVSCIVNFSAKISPATCKSPPIPTPPLTVNAPVEVETEIAVELIVSVLMNAV